MKKFEKNNFAMLLELIWGMIVLVGTGYVVFFLHKNGWWFLLAILLLSADFYIKKTEE
jgi:hypothetical protein